MCNSNKSRNSRGKIKMNQKLHVYGKTKNIKIIISIICISFVQGLQFCVSPVLGLIQEQYKDVSVSMIQMLVTIPTFLSIVMALISGILVIKISKKKLLIFAGLVAGATGLLPLLFDSFWLLFISRALYGVALGLCIALNTAVVAEFFENDERVRVMGIQAASVGAGMVIITALSGALGAIDLKYSYYTNIIGFLAAFCIAICLPETGVVRTGESNKLKLNKLVFAITFYGVLEFLFIISFSTNIAMHLTGKLTGDTAAAGILTGIFSGAQIVIGLLLARITKITKKYSIPVSMLFFSIGGILLILFPSNLIMLSIGAIFCGFSQGIFVPTAMVEVSNSVSPAATVMAAACLTCGNCFGQLISPTVLNNVAKLMFGIVSPNNVYIVAVIGMTITAMAIIIGKKRRNSLEIKDEVRKR